MGSPAVGLAEAVEAAGLDEHRLTEESVEKMLEDFTGYLVTEHKGRNQGKSYGTDHLDKDEVPDREGREGETRVKMAFDDIQYLFDDRIAARSYGLPEERSEEAFGALFGASYALQRHQIAENDSFPEGFSVKFRDSIENEEEHRKFMEFGAYDIRRKVIDEEGYNYNKLLDIMDAGAAMEAYNDIVEEVTGEELSDRLMDY